MQKVVISYGGCKLHMQDPYFKDIMQGEAEEAMHIDIM